MPPFYKFQLMSNLKILDYKHIYSYFLILKNNFSKCGSTTFEVIQSGSINIASNKTYDAHS